MANDPRLGKRIIAEVRLVRYERRIEKAITKALVEHKTRVLRNLRHQHLTAAAPPDAFDEVAWDTTIDDFVKPAINGVLTELRDSTFNFLKLPPEVRARALGRIDVMSRTDQFASVVAKIGPSTAARVMDELSQGIGKGESMDQLSNRIDDAFDIAENDAYRIARTETHGAAESTTYDSAGAINESGLAITKSWLATNDGRTRDTHIFAEDENQDIPYDDMFQVGDSECDYPGNTGDPAEDINCRCTVVYSSEDD